MTKQVFENIYYQGDLLFLTKAPHLPKKDSRIVHVENPVQDITDIFNTTMCWRRYIGTWTILDGKLYLCHLKGFYQLASPEPILADWFSGTLSVSKVRNNDEASSFKVDIEKGLVIEKE